MANRTTERASILQESRALTHHLKYKNSKKGKLHRGSHKVLPPAASQWLSPFLHGDAYATMDMWDSVKGLCRNHRIDAEFMAVIQQIYWKRFVKQMRAQVTELLQDRQTLSGDKKQGPPQPTEEVLLINELVREYLEWNGYLYTASVMTSESAMPKTKRTRAELCMEVGVKDDEKSSALPLLSNIVAAYTERIRRKMNKSKKEKDVY